MAPVLSLLLWVTVYVHLQSFLHAFCRPNPTLCSSCPQNQVRSVVYFALVWSAKRPERRGRHHGVENAGGSTRKGGWARPKGLERSLKEAGPPERPWAPGVVAAARLGRTLKLLGSALGATKCSRPQKNLCFSSAGAETAVYSPNLSHFAFGLTGQQPLPAPLQLD